MTPAIMMSNRWILSNIILVRIMYIMLNEVCMIIPVKPWPA